jgi:hypothetical protein
MHHSQIYKVALQVPCAVFMHYTLMFRHSNLVGLLQAGVTGWGQLAASARYVMLTIRVYLVDKLHWVKILRIKHICLALEGRLQRHSSSAAWLRHSSLHRTPALRHIC